MIAGFREKMIVGEGGRIKFSSTELPAGTLVEVIVLVEPEEQDTTAYLLSKEATPRHLLQALRDLDTSSSYIYVDPS